MRDCYKYLIIHTIVHVAPLRRPHSFSEDDKEKPVTESIVTLRRPHSISEDVEKGKRVEDVKTDQGKNIYTLEYLARLALSPLCLIAPNDWERISNEYPTLVRKVSYLIYIAEFVFNNDRLR